MANYSHHDDPLSTDPAHVGGYSRNSGGAPDPVKQKVIDTIISKANERGLSKQDTANLIAIAKVESGFNPDAATPGRQSSASGVFQVTDQTARDAQQRLNGTPMVGGHRLGTFDRFDLNSNIDHGISIYLDKKRVAGSSDAGDIYKVYNTRPAEYNRYLGQLRSDSGKYLGELQSTGGVNLASTGSAAPLITASGHPGHALYQLAQRGLEKWNHDHHIQADAQGTRNAAAALAVEAHRHGLKRIDHVEPSANGDKLIAAQGQPGTAHSKVVDVPAMQALNTPVEQSSQAFYSTQQAQSQQPAQQPAVTQQPVQSVPAMTR